MDRRHFLTGALSTVIAGSGCLGDGRSGGSNQFPDTAEAFRQFQYDARNSGVTAARPPRNGTLRWKADRNDLGSPEGRISGLALVDNLLLVTKNENLHALDPSDGSERWSIDFAGGTPACTEDTAYVSWSDPDEAGLRAIDLADGSERWRSPLGERITSSPTLVEETIYLSVLQASEPQGGAIVAVDAGDGEELWDFKTAQWAPTPAVVDETVYVAGGNEGVAYALEAETGEKLWETSMPDWMRIAPTVIDDIVYVPTSFANHVFALDAEDGTERWRFEALVTASVTATPDSVYVPTYGGIAVLDAEGKQKREQDLGNSFDGHAPVLADETLVVAGESAISLDVTDGSRHWEQTVAEGTYADTVVSSTSCSPVVSGGVAFIGTAAGDVYAVGE